MLDTSFLVVISADERSLSRHPLPESPESDPMYNSLIGSTCDHRARIAPILDEPDLQQIPIPVRHPACSGLEVNPWSGNPR